MKVFISWSGERSRRVAGLLDDWLRCVVQFTDPWMSSKDIDRGALWFSEISDQLANTAVGIVCLTKENLNKPWILFEAGALAKGISSNRVCTFLIDLKSTDIRDPLAQFNHTEPDETGMWQLVRTINLSLKDKPLKESTLEKVFNTYWGQFKEKFDSIIKETPEGEMKETRSESDILLEILSSVRMLDRRVRKIEAENESPLVSRFPDENNKERLSLSDYDAIIREYAAQGFDEKGIARRLVISHGLPPRKAEKIAQFSMRPSSIGTDIMKDGI